MSMKIALAGNPNCGKTTLFNALTGSNQFVGNWPGVTVEKKEGKLKKSFQTGADDIVIADLPGIYSLSPYTPEEVVARNYLIAERPDAIINIIDGTNLERNLYLSTQLMELGIPVVLAVNMMDIVEKNGDVIRTEQLSKKLGCEVTEISALKGSGLEQTVQKAVSAARRRKGTPAHEFAPEVEEVLRSVQHKLEGAVPEEQCRFFAVKLLERDDKIQDRMAFVPDVSEEIDGLENRFDDDTESIITNERYAYISGIMESCITKKRKEKLTVSDKIDKIVTNRFLALPIFAAVMILVYYISVSTAGAWATDWTNDGLFGDGWHLFGIGAADYGEAVTEYAREHVWTEEMMASVSAAQAAGVIGAEEILEAIRAEDFEAFQDACGLYGASLEESGLNISGIADAALQAAEAPDAADYGVWVPGIPVLAGRLLEKLNCAGWLSSLILDGVIAGVGAVLGFLPQMLMLFLFLSFMESCGYMARIAFIMDRIFRKFGLSGKSFIPMLIGSGCGVPGIMASRTIENDRDRKMTIITTTFVPCGAKLPVISLISAALFGNAWWVAPSAYFVGVAAIVCSGVMLKKTKRFSGDPAPFVMELPAYHWPTAGGVLRSVWERGRSFMKKAGTIILLSSIVIWAGSRFGVVNGRFMFDAGMELGSSVLGAVGSAVKWIFAPLGFDRTEAAVAAIMGLVAKEEIVGVFGVLDFAALTKLSAYSFLVFNLLCAPCFAAMGAIRREMNHAGWFWFAIGYQCGLAYAVSLCIYQFGILISRGAFGFGTAAAFLLAAGMIWLLVRPHRESTAPKLRLKKISRESKSL